MRVYILYIINNLCEVKPEDAINDYQPLYDDIESQILQQHKKLSKLNEFLTVRMTTKFLLIDNKIKIYRDELKNVKNTFINIKALQLMDSKEIISYLSTVDELQKLGVQLELIEDVTGLNNLVFQTEAANYDKITGKKKYDMPKETLCTNINQFINKLIKYYKFLFNELKGISLIDSKSKNKKPTTLEGIVSNPETKMKKTIDIFLDNVYDILNY